MKYYVKTEAGKANSPKASRRYEFEVVPKENNHR